jgi:hypothetical protein
MSDPASLDSTLQALARQPFRARFHLRGRDAGSVELRDMEVVRKHATELLAKRLAPAAPHKDGKPTPYRSHPAEPTRVSSPSGRDLGLQLSSRRKRSTSPHASRVTVIRGQ